MRIFCTCDVVVSIGKEKKLGRSRFGVGPLFRRLLSRRFRPRLLRLCEEEKGPPAYKSSTGRKRLDKAMADRATISSRYSLEGHPNSGLLTLKKGIRIKSKSHYPLHLTYPNRTPTSHTQLYQIAPVQPSDAEKPRTAPFLSFSFFLGVSYKLISRLLKLSLSLPWVQPQLKL